MILIDPSPEARRRRDARPMRGPALALGALLLLFVAVGAGFGWLDLIRAHGARAGGGPLVDDSLPLRRLAGQSAQPLARVALAWVSVGLGAGLLLGGFSRIRRLALLAPCSLIALLVASQAAYAVEETQNFASTLFGRTPGVGPLLEATLLTLGAIVIPRRPRRPGR